LPKTLSEKNLSYSEALRILEEEEARRDLSNIERYTLEYLRKFSKIRDPAKAREAVERLVKELDLPEVVAVQLVNVKPSDVQEVKVFVAYLSKVYTDEELKKVLEILSSAE
jgi:DNA-directed RNA polymerase subunit F